MQNVTPPPTFESKLIELHQAILKAGNLANELYAISVYEEDVNIEENQKRLQEFIVLLEYKLDGLIFDYILKIRERKGIMYTLDSETLEIVK